MKPAALRNPLAGAHGGTPRWLRRTAAHLLAGLAPSRRAVVLLFHRVRPAFDPLRPDEPDMETFSAQVALLARHFDVLPLPEVVERLAESRLRRAALCITFDDGYEDNASLAAPILQRLGLPATFFVSSGYLDGGIMWNDKVIEAFRSAAPGLIDLSPAGLPALAIGDPPSRVQAYGRVLDALKYEAPEERSRAVEKVVRCCHAEPPRTLMMSSAQVADLARRGMTIGGHTMTHPILTRLSDEAARHEIETGKQALERLTGAPLQVFAYPNGRPGRDYDGRHVQMARASGFRAAVSTAWGALRRDSNPFQVPRISSWGNDHHATLLRVARAFWSMGQTV
jgi:peptidoglycan/xylan/chitin deacetylase (PgdA/CDA1 family)